MLNWRSFREQTMDSDAFEFNIYNGFHGNPFRTYPTRIPPSPILILLNMTMRILWTCLVPKQQETGTEAKS